VSGTPAPVALVVVSHSADIARGTVALAAQMAPDVLLLAAGGLHVDGRDEIGTAVDRVLEAVERGLGEAAGGVVVLTDLGSAVLTTDLVLEMVDAERVRVPDAPLVEGAVAAAVAAQQGGDLAAVEAAAVAAGRQYAPQPAAGAGAAVGAPPGPAARPADAAPAPASLPTQVTAHVMLRNPLGLHARTAAVVARAAAETGAPVTVDGVDGTSLLALMALGATGGRELTITASGPHAQEAVDTLVELVQSGFGEV
jgi:PTS hybrid protein